MRKLIMKMSISIDGFVGGPKGEKDWVFKTGDDQSLAWSVEQTQKAGLIIMGRKTFDLISAYWPTAPGPFAEPMNTIPKAVFTNKGYKHNALKPGASAAEVSWAQSRVFDGDLAEGIKKLKAEPGKPILAIGGAGFIRNLISTGLVDEFVLGTHPVALGSGESIFKDLSIPLYMKLVDVKTFPGGTIARTYAV